MRLTPTLLLGTLMTAAVPAQAVMYLSLGGSASTNNVPLQTYESRSGSASVGFDLGRYVRLGYTHRQEFSTTSGWEERLDQSGARVYPKVYNRTHVLANSVDLTVILYEGEVLVPYLQGGAVVKTYNFETRTETDVKRQKLTMPPVPNLGAGIGLRLNREFTLKLSYVASPGYAQEPNGEIKGVWDKHTTVQLTYQL